MNPSKQALKYAWRIARETLKKRPMTEQEMSEAKKLQQVNDINEIMRSKE